MTNSCTCVIEIMRSVIACRYRSGLIACRCALLSDIYAPEFVDRALFHHVTEYILNLQHGTRKPTFYTLDMAAVDTEMH